MFVLSFETVLILLIVLVCTYDFNIIYRVDFWTVCIADILHAQPAK